MSRKAKHSSTATAPLHQPVPAALPASAAPTAAPGQPQFAAPAAAAAPAIAAAPALPTALLPQGPGPPELGELCACGQVRNPGREHHYWHCPIARAVVSLLQAELVAAAAAAAVPPGPVAAVAAVGQQQEQQQQQPPAGPLPPQQPAGQLQRQQQRGRLSAADVWLMRSQRGVTRGVWRLVCLVALSAMDYGRRLAARRILEGHRSVQPGPQFALQVQRAAVVRFWGILSEFCALGGAPEQWQHSAAEGLPPMQGPSSLSTTSRSSGRSSAWRAAPSSAWRVLLYAYGKGPAAVAGVRCGGALRQFSAASCSRRRPFDRQAAPGSWCGFWFLLQVVVLVCGVFQLFLALALRTDHLCFCGARSRGPAGS